MITARIERNEKTKKWYVKLRGKNGEPLFDNYNRKVDAVSAAELLNQGVRIIAIPIKKKKAVKKKKK